MQIKATERCFSMATQRILSTSAMLVLRQGKEFFKEITKLYKLHYI